jgi:hypothetical protein
MRKQRRRRKVVAGRSAQLTARLYPLSRRKISTPDSPWKRFGQSTISVLW